MAIPESQCEPQPSLIASGCVQHVVLGEFSATAVLGLSGVRMFGLAKLPCRLLHGSRSQMLWTSCSDLEPPTVSSRRVGHVSSLATTPALASFFGGCPGSLAVYLSLETPRFLASLHPLAHAPSERQPGGIRAGNGQHTWEGHFLFFSCILTSHLLQCTTSP